jgi:hypothetical protein
MKKLSRIHITELFLVKADWSRTFMGQIFRETQKDGSELVHGNVVIHEGKAWSSGKDQAELATNLDFICQMKLDRGLHEDIGKFGVIANSPFYFN